MYKNKKALPDIIKQDYTVKLIFLGVILLVSAVNLISACIFSNSMRELGNISLFDEHTQI